MPIVVVASLSVLQSILVLVHVAVYESFAAAFAVYNPALRDLFIALAFSFIVTSVLAYRSGSRLVAWFYTAAAYWFGLAFFLFMGALGFYIAATVLYHANYYVNPALLGGIAFGTLFLIHLYGTWKSLAVELTEISVILPNLPPAWRGKKILFVSDVHLGAILRGGFSEKVVLRIKAQNPEMVLIGGDLYDGVRCDTAGVLKPLADLRPPRGIYYITGNHEYYFPDWEDGKRAIQNAGIKILNDEKATVDGLSIVGIDFKTGAKKETLEKALANIGDLKGAPSIVLKHEPNHLEEVEHAGAPLLLAGHTHQGQIFPLNFITRQMYRGFDYGLQKLGGMQVYTSSGVGTWGPPLRLGTKSEIVLITLQ